MSCGLRPGTLAGSAAALLCAIVNEHNGVSARSCFLHGWSGISGHMAMSMVACCGWCGRAVLSALTWGSGMCIRGALHGILLNVAGRGGSSVHHERASSEDCGHARNGGYFVSRATLSV